MIKLVLKSILSVFFCCLGFYLLEKVMGVDLNIGVFASVLIICFGALIMSFDHG